MDAESQNIIKKEGFFNVKQIFWRIFEIQSPESCFSKASLDTWTYDSTKSDRNMCQVEKTSSVV